MQEGVDEVLEFLRIEIEALDVCQNVDRSFKVGVLAGVLDAFVDFLC